jgi:Bacterial protein of unknown function (DUF899)
MLTKPSLYSQEQQTAVYNYKAGGFGSSEAPGVSVFIKGADGQIFHTYSYYARGLDMRLSPARPGAQGPRRTGSVLPDGLGAPARPVRGLRKAAGDCHPNVGVGEFAAAF